jgi:hypothetical protein
MPKKKKISGYFHRRTWFLKIFLEQTFPDEALTKNHLDAVKKIIFLYVYRP